MDETINIIEELNEGYQRMQYMRILIFISLFLLLWETNCFTQKVINLYEGQAPGSENWTQKEREMIVPGLNIVLVQNVTQPTLRVYAPPTGKANGTAIIVAPGGGFETIVESVEGTPVAKWLNSKGITVFILRYRIFKTVDNFVNLPDRKSGLDPDLTKRMAMFNKELKPLVLSDAKLAVKYVRQHSSEFGVVPERIGFMGFSAGGAVATVIAEEYDSLSRPDFVAPIYAGTLERISVPLNAPPIFIVHASDDKIVSVNGSIDLYKSWKQAGAIAELHIYSKGGHGFALMKRGLPVDTWTDRFEDWLKNLGFQK